MTDFFVDSLLLEDGSNLRLEDGERLALDITTEPSGADAPRLKLDLTDQLVDFTHILLLESGTGGILLEGKTAASSELSFFDNSAVWPGATYVESRWGRSTSGGPGFRTIVQTTADGGDNLIRKWSRPMRHWSITTGLHESAANLTSTPSLVESILAFYRAQRGGLYGFRMEDPSDWSTSYLHRQYPSFTDYRDRHVIGSGDGTTTTFQLVKRYRAGDVERIRPITRPVVVLVWVGGVIKGVGTDLTVSYDGGEIEFASAPAKGQVIEWAGTFHVPARFSGTSDNAFPQDLTYTELSAYGSIGLSELKEGLPFSSHKQTGGFGEIAIPAGATSWGLSLNDGHVQRITPSLVGTTIIRTPMPAQVIDGGPVLIVVNGAAAASGKLMTIRTPHQSSSQTVVTTLAEGAYAVLYYHEDGTWLAVR